MAAGYAGGLRRGSACETDRADMHWLPLSSVRSRLIVVSLLLGLGLTAQSACSSKGDSKAACQEGAEGCSCYPNESCDSGLECHSGLCVEEDVGNDAGGSSSGGSSSDAGGSSSGGSSSDAGGSSSDAGGSSSDAGGSSSDAGGSSSGGSSSGGSSSDAGGASNDAGGSSNGGSGNCEDGAQGCSCYPNATCNDGLACQSDVCVSATTSSGGAGGSAGTGGATSSGGTAGTGGTGGGATGGTGGGGSDPAIIDDFASCDGDIAPVDGRDGGWFTFGDDDVNVTPTSNVAAQSPPSDFEDPSCAAWYTTGCGETAVDCTFAGIGFVFFEDESPYDLSAYQALQVRREGDAQWVIAHMSGGLTFGASLATGTGTRTLYFYDFVPSGETDIYALPDWSQVTKIEFTSLTPEASGFAIYDLRLL